MKNRLNILVSMIEHKEELGAKVLSNDIQLSDCVFMELVALFNPDSKMLA